MSVRSWETTPHMGIRIPGGDFDPTRLSEILLGSSLERLGAGLRVLVEVDSVTFNRDMMAFGGAGKMRPAGFGAVKPDGSKAYPSDVVRGLAKAGSAGSEVMVDLLGILDKVSVQSGQGSNVQVQQGNAAVADPTTGKFKSGVSGTIPVFQPSTSRIASHFAGAALSSSSVLFNGASPVSEHPTIGLDAGKGGTLVWDDTVLRLMRSMTGNGTTRVVWAIAADSLVDNLNNGTTAESLWVEFRQTGGNALTMTPAFYDSDGIRFTGNALAGSASFQRLVVRSPQLTNISLRSGTVCYFEVVGSFAPTQTIQVERCAFVRFRPRSALT